MCGLAGIAFINTEVALRPDLDRELHLAAEKLSHRGPNDEGIWQNPSSKVGLCFRRLSILDLSERGHQPMRDDCGNALAFNGEIYNFKSLRETLSEYSFQSGSDTEVLLHKMSKMGPSCIEELDGMFAFAHFSAAKNELTLAVDPAGKKPLYTYWDGKIFAFASEIKALRAFSRLDFGVDRENLKSSLVYGYVPCPFTLYRNVRKLPAGHFQIVHLTKGPQNPVAYWDVPLGQTNFKMPYDEAQAELRSLMRQSVQKRLIADVAVGCFLSGGLDSSIVALEAAKALPPHSLQTFSAGFEGNLHNDFYDETPYARRVAKLVRSAHTELQIDATNTAAPEIMKWFDEPFGDSSAIPTYLICARTADHVKVVLSGDGGDELFGGYLRFRAALLSESIAPYFKFFWLLFRRLNLRPVRLWEC